MRGGEGKHGGGNTVVIVGAVRAMDAAAVVNVVDIVDIVDGFEEDNMAGIGIGIGIGVTCIVGGGFGDEAFCSIDTASCGVGVGVGESAAGTSRIAGVDVVETVISFREGDGC
jgi:hypothetical protein